MARMKVFLQICVVAAVFFVGVGGDMDEVKEVYNHRLDIALLYDQSRGMSKSDRRVVRVWNGVQDWIKDYFKSPNITNVNETRFAAIGCRNYRQAILHFDDSGEVKGNTRLEKILAAQDYVRKESGDGPHNNEQCANSALTNVFIPEKGDRADVDNIVFYISDCELNGPVNDNPIRKMRKKMVKKFLFICTSDKYNGVRSDGKTRYGYTQLLEWLDGDANSVYNFTNEKNLVTKLNEFLPKINITIVNCKLNSSQQYSYTECMLNVNGSCTKTKYPNIIKFPQHAPPCDDNVTEQCAESECMTSISTTSDMLSLSKTETTADQGTFKSKETISSVTGDDTGKGENVSTVAGSTGKERSIGTNESADFKQSTSVSDAGKKEQVSTVGGKQGKGEETSSVVSTIFSQSTDVGELGKAANFSTTAGGQSKSEGIYSSDSTDFDKSTSVGEAVKMQSVSTFSSGPPKGEGNVTGQSTDFGQSPSIGGAAKSENITTVIDGPGKIEGTGTTESVSFTQSISTVEHGKGENFSTVDGGPSKGQGTEETTDFEISTAGVDHGKTGNVSTVHDEEDVTNETGITETISFIESTSVSELGKGEKLSTPGDERDKWTDTVDTTGHEVVEAPDSSKTPAIIVAIIFPLLCAFFVVIIGVVVVVIEYRKKTATNKGKQIDAEASEMKRIEKGKGTVEMKQSEKDGSSMVDIAGTSRVPSRSKTSQSVVTKSETPQFGKSDKSIGGKGAIANSAAVQKSVKDTSKKSMKKSDKK